jgi:alpha-galactosidase
MRRNVMKKSSITVVTMALFFVVGALAPRAQTPSPADHADDDGLALTPPMGWYPWNIFGQEPQNEKLIKEIVDALVASGLKDAGYSYVGPDEGICFVRGNDGLLTTNLQRYPSGLRGLGDYIHRKGLKYALYTDAGSRTCSGAMPGTKGHEFEDMRCFAEWRADYVKIDWCNTEGQDIVKTYTKLHDAQHAVGRPIVHSLCSWGEGSPWLWAAPVGHLWRTTADICAPANADWARALRMAFANERLAAFAGPGHWNDPDMMIVGMPGLTDAQSRTLFSLWCMMAAPLMAGNDLRGMSESTISTLTNLEAIAVDQDPLGVQGKIVWTDGNISLWAGKPLFDGSRAVLVFNQGRHPAEKRVMWSEIGMEEKAANYVRNLWTHQTTGPEEDGTTVRIEPDGVAMLRISGKADFPIPPIIVADSYLISLRAAGSAPETLSAVITLSNRGGADLPLWRVSGRVPSWLNVAVTKSGNFQKITNTITTGGLRKGPYHAVIRLDNTEPLSGRPMSAVHYDVDLVVPEDIKGVGR